MSRGKDLLKNTGILLIAKISTQIVSFLLLPLYTSFLTTEQYGCVDVYTSLAMIVIPFLTLQVEMALFRFFITDKDQSTRQEIVSTSFAVVICMAVAISVVYWSCAVFFRMPYKGMLYAYYLTQMFSTVLLQVCRAEGDNAGYGIASFISSSMAVVLNVIFIVGLHWKVEGILISSVLAQLSSCIFMLFWTKVHRYLKIISVKKRCCKKLLQYSIPLVFNQIASWAINYSDRLLILAYWGESSNGIYSIANKFSNITNTFFGVYNVAWTENVVRSMEDKNSEEYVSKVFDITFNLYMILITGILNILPFIFGVLVNESFADAYPHIPILLIAMLFSGMAATLGSIYIAYGRTKDISITTALAGVCNIVVHFALLNKFKLFAASISTLVSFAALFLYRGIAIRKFYRIRFQCKKWIVRLIIMVFAWIVYFSYNPYLILIGLVANLLSVILLFKENKTLLIGLIKKK
jgi:O-antigen/teichoic acid export membrane protein